jgi:sulfur carrier protein
MEIKVNNQQQEIKGETSLKAIMDQLLGERQKGIAVAVNDRVVPKCQWGEYFFKDHDQVLVIKATQGG